MKFIDFSKSIKEEIFPIYLAEGAEAYFRDRVVELLREKCVQQPMLNDVRVEGETLKGERLVSFCDELSVLPFLSEKRLVRVYEFYPTEKEYETHLKKYFESPCPSTVLLIVNSGKKANACDLRKKKGVTLVDCAKESEDVLSRWVIGTARRAGLSADTDAVQTMVRYCNYDTARMKTELEKLALLLGEGGRITRAVVDEYINKDVDYKIYELTQAASRKSFSVFSSILTDLLQKGYDEHAVLASLTSHYRTLYDVTAAVGSDATVAQALGIKPYAVQKNREIASRLGKERVAEYYLALYQLSCGAKSGLYTKEGALTSAIAKIFFS